jgi:hypothetical protein
MRTVIRALLALAFLFIAPPAFGSDANPPADAFADEPPPAPQFAGWSVKSDSVVPRDQIAQLEARINTRIKAMRKVIYDVNGKTVQVNVTVPRDAHETDKLYILIMGKKPSWSVARKGDVIYEFVGKNESIDEMKKAHDKLAGP